MRAAGGGEDPLQAWAAGSRVAERGGVPSTSSEEGAGPDVGGRWICGSRLWAPSARSPKLQVQVKLMFDPPCDLCLSLAPAGVPSQRSLALALGFGFTEERGVKVAWGVSLFLALA